MVKTADMGARKAGEKASGFAVTCSLLSQYLKERGSLGDIVFGISAAAPAPAPPLPLPEARGKPELPRTMNLLEGVEAAEEEVDGAAASDPRIDPALSMNLFSQRAGFGLSEEKRPDLTREAQRGQMTILYGGKVVVFDNFPADKAKELMAMAGRGCPTPVQRSKSEQTAPVPPARHNPATAALATSSEAKSAAAAATAAAPTPAVAAQEAPRKPTQPAASDLPIARRVSLHRFLEKRKDRISAKAPYPVMSGSPASLSSSPAMPEETRRWLGLAPHASQKQDLHPRLAEKTVPVPGLISKTSVGSD